MICPKCGAAQLVLWPWIHGGYKGVECPNDACGEKWWSDSMNDALDYAKKKAVADCFAAMDFPEDARTDEEQAAHWLTLDGDEEEE